MTKGQRIKARREELRFTQEDVAKAVGVTKQTIYKYEKDIISNIPSDIVDKLALVLDVSPSYIMGWSETQEKQSRIRWTDKINNILEEPHETTDIRQLQRIFAYASKILELPAGKVKQITDYIDFILSKEDD